MLFSISLHHTRPQVGRNVSAAWSATLTNVIKSGQSVWYPVKSFLLAFSDKFASYRAAGANAGNEPERKGAAELPEIRKVDGTQ